MDKTDLARLYDFTGKTFVITGGAGVLGGVVAAALYGCGANVCLLGRNASAVQTAAERLGGRALGVPADVTRRDDLVTGIGAAGSSRPVAVAGVTVGSSLVPCTVTVMLRVVPCATMAGA